MNRKEFIYSGTMLAAGLTMNKALAFAGTDYPMVRIPEAKRKFTSKAVEEAIQQFGQRAGNKELAWLFNNCLPNTLDTTVTHTIKDGKPDTYVITGDIDAMWLRDSSAQVWPYLQFMKKDEPLKQLVAGIINRQARYVLHDPYANAFYDDPNKKSEWASDHTQMKPGVHERKWEVDSLCYTMRLAYHYWKLTGDKQPFDAQWKSAVELIYDTFTVQQREHGQGPYKFQRNTSTPTDTLPLGGYGFPVKPTGMICSMFRPSDDATLYAYLIPSNLFAVVSLRQMAEMFTAIFNDHTFAAKLTALALHVEKAVYQYAIVQHPVYGKIFAFEVDGFGNVNLMDDANVPSLLSLPYLGAVKQSDPIYQNTRRFVLSAHNPYYYKSADFEGIGGPHVGRPDMIWPLSIITRGLTSTNDAEIKQCLKMLAKSSAGSGFMHESFNMHDPKNFTRSWFAWCNTIFGEFLWKVFQTKPHLLQA